MKRMTFFGILAVLFLSSSAAGWGVFNDGADNNCAACHEGNAVMADHSAVGCLSCHTAAPGDVPVTSNCSACHGTVEMVNYHNDAGIMSCGMCHAGLTNDRWSWSELKSRFHR